MCDFRLCLGGFVDNFLFRLLLSLLLKVIDWLYEYIIHTRSYILKLSHENDLFMQLQSDEHQFYFFTRHSSQKIWMAHKMPFVFRFSFSAIDTQRESWKERKVNWEMAQQFIMMLFVKRTNLMNRFFVCGFWAFCEIGFSMTMAIQVRNNWQLTIDTYMQM